MSTFRTFITFLALILCGWLLPATVTAQAACPVKASFSPGDTTVFQNANINFRNLSSAASTYKWYVNNNFISTSTNLNYSFPSVGAYTIKLIAGNGSCTSELVTTVVVMQQCFQASFQKILHSSGNETVSQVYNLADESILIAGSVTRSGRPDKDAFLMRLDRRGKLLWSKYYGGQSDDYFKKVSYNEDAGSIMAIGETKSYGAQSGTAWVVALDLFGEVKWSQVYNNSASFGLVFTAMTNVGNSIGVTGTYNNGGNTDAFVMAIYGFDGRVFLNKRLSNSNNDAGTATYYSGDTINIASMTQAGSDGDIMLFGISRDGKTIYYTRRIHVANTINRPIGMFKTNKGLVISSITTDAAGNNSRQLWFNLSPTLSVSSVINVKHGSTTEGFTSHTLEDGYLWNASSTGNSIVVSNYKSGIITVHKKLDYAQPVNLQSIAVNTDSSISIAATININGNNDILIDKTTLEGSNYGCNTTDAVVTTDESASITSNTDWESISDFSYTSAVISGLSSGDLAMTVETLCEAPICSTEDVVTCNATTFFKTYVDDYNTVGFNGMVVRDNDVLTLGGTPQGLGLTSLSFSGQVNSIKQFGTKNYYPYLYRFMEDRDKNLVFNGSDTNQFYNISRLLLMKTDASGNLLWNKTYKISLSVDASRLIECSDGNYLLVSQIDRFIYDIKNTIVIMKIDKNNGNVIWIKQHQTGRYSFNLPDIKRVGNKVLVLANSASGPYPKDQSYLFVFDENTGNAIASREYSSNEMTYYLRNIHSMGSGFLISGIYHDKNSSTNCYFSVLDENFNLKRTRFLKVDNNAAVFTGIKNNDNDFVFFSEAYDQDSRSTYQQLFKIDSLLNVVWIRKNGPGIKEYMWSISFNKLPDNSFIATGAKNYNANYNNFSNGFVSKFTSSGALLGCSSNPVTYSYEPYATTLTNFTLEAMTAPEVTTSVPVFASSNAPLLQIRSVKCNQPSACTFIKVTGPDSLCNSIDTAVFKISRNPNCISAIEWKVDMAYMKVLGYTDSTMSAKFIRTGAAKIYASVDAGCTGVLADSMKVVGLAAPTLLNLGNDTTLCAGASFVLHASKNYKSYRWQDGSTDSTYLVKGAGIYHVEVADYCGNLHSDTIIVNDDPTAKLTLPAIVTHCKNDTLVLHADNGFDSYTWSPNDYSIGYLTKDIRIFAPKDTTFILTASKTGGCTARDTIRVNTYTANTFNLGSDTTFCSDKPLTLQVPSTFSNVTWSTGNVGNALKISASGIYAVKAKDLNGCYNADTIGVVMQVTPVFSFGNDTAICDNKKLLLKQSVNGTYLWQDGSTLKEHTVSNTGLYWLQVDNQGCNYRDSIRVGFKPLPNVLLGNDTTICEGSYKELKVNQLYTNVLWQNGSTNHSLLAYKTGTYYVKAELEGCTASDTIKILQFLKPSFDLGKDTVLCEGHSLRLDVKVENATFLWNNGSVLPGYTVTSPGTYKLTATNICGSFSDEIIVEPGACKIEMPSAFSPNKDGLNDLFRLKYPGAVRSIVMQIFNRFGQPVFNTSDPNKGWDGTVNGRPQDSGNYVWTISYVTIDGEKGNMKGSVVLIR